MSVLPRIALSQSIPSMPAPVSAAIFSTPFGFDVAKEEATGAKTREMEIEIARMVRMRAKNRNTSNLKTLSVGTGECVLKTFDDASFVFRQRVRSFFRNDA